MAADRIGKSHPPSFTVGTRGPKLLLRHAHPDNTACRGSVGEDKALTGKGWLR